jgi:hypothetical protein
MLTSMCENVLFEVKNLIKFLPRQVRDVIRIFAYLYSRKLKRGLHVQLVCGQISCNTTTGTNLVEKCLALKLLTLLFC